MLLVFHPNGSIEFTRNPKALELVPEGTFDVQRMTEIAFDKGYQKYYIVFKLGPFTGMALRWRDGAYSHGAPAAVLEQRWNEYLDDPTIYFRIDPDRRGRVHFATYEDAVAVEIAFVDYLRECGVSMV